MEPAGTVLDKIIKYQTYLEKSVNYPDTNEENIMIILSKLKNLPITLEHLQDTGVGKTVNSYRKHCSENVANYVRSLVSKWKLLAQAAAMEMSQSNGSNNDSSSTNECLSIAANPVNTSLSDHRKQKINDYCDTRLSDKTQLMLLASQTTEDDEIDNPYHKNKQSSSEVDERYAMDLPCHSSVIQLTNASDDNRSISSALKSFNGDKSRTNKSSSQNRHNSTSSRSSHGHSKSAHSSNGSKHSKSVIKSNCIVSDSMSHGDESISNKPRTNEKKLHHSSSSKITSSEKHLTKDVKSNDHNESSSSESRKKEKHTKYTTSTSSEIKVDKKLASLMTSNSSIESSSSDGRKSEKRSENVASSYELSRKRDEHSRSKSIERLKRHSSAAPEPISEKKRTCFEVSEPGLDAEADDDNNGLSFEELLNYDARKCLTSKKKKVPTATLR